ncbi:MAG: PD-(D/E)XK nuclease family protein [Aestuariibaculum sp.]
MATFIIDVLQDLKNKKVNLSNQTFILPSKRAGLFLKHQLHLVSDTTIFSPTIISIEEFVEKLSQLKALTNTELLFEFYATYLNLTPNNPDTFEVFSKWAQILIQDFNEIDRYHIPQKQIFDYLGAIQELSHWSLQENQTDFIKNYLIFWKKLHRYYIHFTQQLLSKNIGYQGLLYREAVNKLKHYVVQNPDAEYVFLGFNALNTCEETIIQHLLENNKARIYWDIDTTFINHTKHDAALFIRQHKNNWPYFKKHPFNWITDYYSQNKNINVYGVPKNIGQARQIGTILKHLRHTNPTLEKVAVILGDENLLIPTLNALPEYIKTLNITMGIPLKSVSMASLFEILFGIHKIHTKTFYYKEVISLLEHQFIKPLLYINGTDYAFNITSAIENNNLIYITSDRLKQLAPKLEELIDLLFLNWNTSPKQALRNALVLILKIKEYLNKNTQTNALSLEYLFRFHELFNELDRLNTQYNHIKDISALYGVYKELLDSQTLNFQGEPLQGLQIMGMLESRVLDFETVIIASVNEGILPSGKSNNSFIPFDVKLENKLPTYKEKDAIYTYHFYHALQRTKNIHILYNTEADVLTGGEKSRFIMQMELEGIHTLNHQIVVPKVDKIHTLPNIVQKDEAIRKAIVKVAKKGFSPSSLTTYIRNPIDFYYQKILKIEERNDVEETVAANTLGTVVHNTLEDFYKPLINTYLTVEVIETLKKDIDKTVAQHFKEAYREGDITKGKNLIVYEIAKRYVSNFLNLEIKDLKAGNTIKILEIEADNTILVDIPEVDFPIKLTGKVDRMDEYNGITRIVDYKTGKVEQKDVELINWEDITTDYDKYSKSFQVLTYALMMHKQKTISFPIEAGIVSFKNLNSGFLKFAKKDKPGRGARKETFITQETLDNFNTELKQLILKICDINIPFIEKDV